MAFLKPRSNRLPGRQECELGVRLGLVCFCKLPALNCINACRIHMLPIYTSTLKIILRTQSSFRVYI